MLSRVTSAVAVLATAAFVQAAPAAAATLTSITPGAVSLGDTVAVRYRGQSTGNEHYVGVDNVGVGANRTEGSVNWANGDYSFLFSYNSTTGAVASELSGPGLSSAQMLSFAGPLGLTTDTLVLQLSNRSKETATMAVSNITVNGEALGSGLTCGAFCEWSVTDFAVGPVLEVAGTLTVDGVFDRNDSERVKFQIAGNTVAPIPLPAALPLMLAGLGGIAALKRRKRKAA